MWKVWKFSLYEIREKSWFYYCGQLKSHNQRARAVVIVSRPFTSRQMTYLHSRSKSCGVESENDDSQMFFWGEIKALLPFAEIARWHRCWNAIHRFLSNQSTLEDFVIETHWNSIEAQWEERETSKKFWRKNESDECEVLIQQYMKWNMIGWERVCVRACVHLCAHSCKSRRWGRWKWLKNPKSLKIKTLYRCTRVQDTEHDNTKQ